MTTLPLEKRPRRVVQPRPPSQRSAARALRRTATPTTARTWRRSGLPGRVVAQAGIPTSESVSSLFIVALVFAPVLLWTGGATGAWIALAATAIAVSYLLWARRLVVGTSWLAVRQLGRYHVATVDHVRHLELKPTQRGGVLCLHTDDGRCMRLRRVELARPDVNAALRSLVERHDGTRDPLVEELLGLPHEKARIRHGYLAQPAH